MTTTTMDRDRLWEVSSRTIVYAAIGAALYGILLVAQVPVPGTTVSVRPAFALVPFFGYAFGPIVGFFTGIGRYYLMCIVTAVLSILFYFLFAYLFFLIPEVQEVVQDAAQQGIQLGGHVDGVDQLADADVADAGVGAGEVEDPVGVHAKRGNGDAGILGGFAQRLACVLIQTLSPKLRGIDIEFHAHGADARRSFHLLGRLPRAGEDAGIEADLHRLSNLSHL